MRTAKIGPDLRLKSIKRFWPHLMAFRSSISTLSTGRREQLLSLMFFFFGFLKSSVVYAVSL